MEITLIILFFILILVCTSKIEIHIENLETVKSKIKFLIKIKFYIFKHILIFSKKNAGTVIRIKIPLSGIGAGGEEYVSGFGGR